MSAAKTRPVLAFSRDEERQAARACLYLETYPLGAGDMCPPIRQPDRLSNKPCDLPALPYK